MFKRISLLSSYSLNRFLIGTISSICLFIISPHSNVVMCYFNRLSGKVERDHFDCMCHLFLVSVAVSPASEAPIVIGAFFSLHNPPVSHGGGRLREW